MAASDPDLTLADARARLAAACAPLPGDRHGVELEWLTYPVADPAGRADPAALDRAAAAAGPSLRGARVTYEPGGQVELSTAPRDTLAETVADLAVAVPALRAALAAEGLRPAGLGLDPVREPRRVATADRYAAMEAYFDDEGPLGRRMMCNTASIQVNVACGPDPARRWRLAHAMGPVLGAAFANSPLASGAPAGWRSARLATWYGMDPTRTAPVPVSGGDPGDDWAAYALAARVMLVPRAGGCARLDGAPTLAEWVERGHPAGWPDADDLAYHLTTLFPPVRPRGWLELRMVDALPDRWSLVPLAVAVAVLTDEEAAGRAEAACAPVANAWLPAARAGLAHPGLAAAAREVFAAALDALPRLGAPGELWAAAAAYLRTYVARGRTPADDRLAEWAGRGVLVPHADPEPSWS